jgi:hypothetical protein
MNETANSAASTGVGLAVFAIVLIICLALYIFACFCMKRICEKCNVQPGILIWIPIVQLVPLLQVAGLPVWTIILFFIPIVGFVMGIVMWAKICTARGKSALLVIGIIFLPIIFIPYLAFSE